MVWLAGIQAGINMKIKICYSTKQTRKCQLEWQSLAKGELGEKNVIELLGFKLSLSAIVVS